MPPAGDDLCRADEGQGAPGLLGCRQGIGGAVDPRHQGAGSLFRRDPADDRQRHLHHQRYRARHRQPVAPLAGGLLRPRQGEDPRQRQAALQRPRDPLPRFLARFRLRPQGHPLRPHRPPPQAAGHGAPQGARLQRRRAAQHLLRHRRDHRCRRRLPQDRRPQAPPRPAGDLPTWWPPTAR